jgi:hypothetical protein
MTDPFAPLSPDDVHAADGVEDWRVLADGACRARRSVGRFAFSS